MLLHVTKEHLAYCHTQKQTEAVEAYIEHGTAIKAAKAISRNRTSLNGSLRSVVKRAAAHGLSPAHDLTHETAPGFATKRVSTAYGRDGGIVLQWHIQEKDKQNMEEMLAMFAAGMGDELRGIHKPVKAPSGTDKDLMSCYILGDHHFGMYAWAPETNDEDFDTEKGDKLLDSAVDRLVTMSPNSETGFLLNTGDFFHSNNTSSETHSGTPLDTDGRFGRTIRMSGHLFKRVIARMLQKHKKVIVLNARGNHDHDSALFLNEMLRMYYEGDERVEVMDNFAKFNHLQFGTNLIISHHGDKINPRRVYEAATRNLRKEWGECEHVFYWYGHIHHKVSEEIGGMICESWNVLPPSDAWHAGSGYGSSRSMTCVILHKEFGEQGRVKVGIRELQS